MSVWKEVMAPVMLGADGWVAGGLVGGPFECLR